MHASDQLCTRIVLSLRSSFIESGARRELERTCWSPPHPRGTGRAAANSLEEVWEQHKVKQVLHCEPLNFCSPYIKASCGRRRMMTRRCRRDRRQSEATIGIPSCRKFGTEHTSDRSNRDRNIAGRINRIMVNSDVPTPEVNKALTLAIHMRRTGRVIKFIERELT